MSESTKMRSRPPVFVVDDDPLVAKALSAMARQAGCDVAVFSSGPAALDALSSESPQLVLLDLVLPGMDGIEVLRRIRDVRPDVAVVMVSGQGTIKAAVDAIKLGASDFLEKPVDQHRLEATLARALEHSR